jgi:adenylate cyclase
MALEIERRFLVREPCAAFAVAVRRHRLTQGYFGHIDELRIRIRILSDTSGDCAALLTLKGARRGLCRLEYEYPLALDAARSALITLPLAQIIRKIRYEIHNHDGRVWSVDRFQGPNSGLVLAEVELAHPDQQIERPSWVGKEVTFDPRYSNSQLARFPLRRFHNTPCAEANADPPVRLVAFAPEGPNICEVEPHAGGSYPAREELSIFDQRRGG